MDDRQIEIAHLMLLRERVCESWAAASINDLGLDRTDQRYAKVVGSFEKLDEEIGILIRDLSRTGGNNNNEWASLDLLDLETTGVLRVSGPPIARQDAAGAGLVGRSLFQTTKGRAPCTQLKK